MSERDDEINRLTAARDKLQSQHEAAVTKLEAQGPDRGFENRAACARAYDALAAAQKRLDAIQPRRGVQKR